MGRNRQRKKPVQRAVRGSESSMHPSLRLWLRSRRVGQSAVAPAIGQDAPILAALRQGSLHTPTDGEGDEAGDEMVIAGLLAKGVQFKVNAWSPRKHRTTGRGGNEEFDWCLVLSAVQDRKPFDETVEGLSR